MSYQLVQNKSIVWIPNNKKSHINKYFAWLFTKPTNIKLDVSKRPHIKLQFNTHTKPILKSQFG